jgi:predicted lipid-binding transport protein (Tim44 family)
MDYDIIIYAIVAIVIFARLWSVLGQRNGEDRERPNPFAAPPTPAASPTPVTATEETPRPAPFLHAPASLAGGLAAIKAVQPSFDEKDFLQGARHAFTLILSDFAKGDLAESGRLLGPTVLPHFRAAIEARRTAAQTMEHKLITIREAECASAKMDGTQAVITVRFISEQQNILRDASGKLVDGSSEQTEEITDLWTFARDSSANDPNWILIETKS